MRKRSSYKAELYGYILIHSVEPSLIVVEYSGHAIHSVDPCSV